MNALFAVNKPIGLSSNQFLQRLKREYGWKKCGYSGTLDPFASGLLIVGVGAYTRLFPYLNKSVKTYEATLWLGAESASLDIEQLHCVSELVEYPLEKIESVLHSFVGRVSYFPPKFSAKHIGGKRAYELARAGLRFELKQSEMEVFEIELLAYAHPFVSFRVSVSEGAYIRSLGEMIAERLGCKGSLSRLKRIAEGGITLSRKIQKLDVLDCLSMRSLDLQDKEEMIFCGKKFVLEGLIPNEPYLLVFEDFFSIIEVNNQQEVQYRLNRIPLC